MPPSLPPLQEPPLPIPARQSHDPDVRPLTLEARRRQRHTSQLRSRKGLAKQHGAPEVISNLIDSLSALDNTDNFQPAVKSAGYAASMSMPSTPTLKSVRSAGSGSMSLRQQYAADFVAYQQMLRGDAEDAGNAAEPPVVRTTKRRPETLPVQPWGKKDPGQALKSYLLAGTRSASTTSLASAGQLEESRPMGTISIESPARPSSIKSGRRASVDSQGSATKVFKTLRAISSREKLRMKETERKRNAPDPVALPGQELLFSAHVDASPASPRRALQGPGEPTIREESQSPPLLPIQGIPLRDFVPERISSVKEGKKPMIDLSPFPPPSPSLSAAPSVPSRRSSLAKVDKSPRLGTSPKMGTSPQLGTSPKVRSSPKLATEPQFRQYGGQYGGQANAKPNVLEEVEEPVSRPNTQPILVQAPVSDRTPAKEAVQETAYEIAASSDGVYLQTPPRASDLDLSDGEHSSVAKRIKELKAQKLERERLAKESPILQVEGSNVSHAASEAARPLGNVPQRDMRQNPNGSALGVKDRKFGGAPIQVPPLGPLTTCSPAANDASEVLSPDDDLPLTPLTPTPLPMDYNFVVNHLGSSVSPPDSKPGSLRSSNNSETSRSRRSRLALGIRSVSAKIEGARNSTFVEHFEPSERSTSFSSSIERMATENSSLGRSNSRRKKRWSQGDLSLGISGLDRKSSGRGDYAVRPPNHPETVVEERPSSVDSIDLAVNAFVRSPRLTQRIRHPTNGRTISFSEVGDPKGHAVFCCVGMGLTRYITAFYDELATTLKLRLITPDRPGVGESQADPMGTPLSWPDDIVAIAQALGINKFSLMAHSAGAIYALATALRMPQHIRGRVHLLAPWIPPSQMAPLGLQTSDPPPGAQLPRAQRFLRVLPAPFLKVANSNFLIATSASLSPNGSSKPKKTRKGYLTGGARGESPAPTSRPVSRQLPRLSSTTQRESLLLMDQQGMPDERTLRQARSQSSLRSPLSLAQQLADTDVQEREAEARRHLYDERLTLAIWSLATHNANPAVDLLVCLERNQPVGFRYVDITRSVVIHHGAKDSRVPVDNVKWLARSMRRCEVRVLEGEGHGLMASAGVMGKVLGEMAREWEDWDRAVKGPNGTEIGGSGVSVRA